WHSDSVVLLGDAAHSMLHHQGQGANSAIEDGGALADALRQADSVKEALALYQATRKPVTDTLQQVSRQGCSEDDIDEVFPGQKPAAAAAKECPMPLHPEIAKVLAGLPAPPAGPLDPAAMRAAEEAQVPPPEERLPLHAVEDLTARTAAGDVPVRVYTPDTAEHHGLIVYFHGGAFFLGSLDTHDHVARSLAKETGLKV